MKCKMPDFLTQIDNFQHWEGFNTRQRHHLDNSKASARRVLLKR
jgi:hypothetical protein